jgi:hypothetical protein
MSLEKMSCPRLGEAMIWEAKIPLAAFLLSSSDKTKRNGWDSWRHDERDAIGVRYDESAYDFAIGLLHEGLAFEESFQKNLNILVNQEFQFIHMLKAQGLHSYRSALESEARWWRCNSKEELLHHEQSLSRLRLLTLCVNLGSALLTKQNESIKEWTYYTPPINVSHPTTISTRITELICYARVKQYFERALVCFEEDRKMNSRGLNSHKENE